MQSRGWTEPSAKALDRGAVAGGPSGPLNRRRLFTRCRFPAEHSLARLGAERLWELLGSEPDVAALGAMTGGQAVQMVRAGLKAIYLSGWQVAADANLSRARPTPTRASTRPTACPALVRRLNNALLRADQIDWSEGRDDTYWLAPIVADAEAGFGGALNAFELMKAMIEAGRRRRPLRGPARGGEEVRPSRRQGARADEPVHPHADGGAARRRRARRPDRAGRAHRRAERDAADERHRSRPTAEFLTGERTPEGFFRVRDGLEPAIARSLAYAPYADLLWFETSTPDLGEAREFAAAIHEQFPGKLLAYNCSPSFNWKRHLDDDQIASFQRDLAELGYRFQFITLAGFHALNARCSSSRAATAPRA